MVSVHRVGRRIPAWFFILPIGLLVALALALWPKAEGPHRLLVAKTDLPAGATVTQADFEYVNLSLVSGAQIYLSDIKGESMLTRSVVQGELLARSAVTTGLLDRRTPVVLSITGELAHTIRVGSTVDVWATQSGKEPVAIAIDATILALQKSTSLGRTVSVVELALATEHLPSVMLAKANGSAIEILLQTTMLDQ